MKKPTSLVLIADGQMAKIFEKIGSQKFDLNLLSEMESELDTNHEKPGRTQNSSGTLRHGFAPHTDRRDVERHKFAEKISAALDELEREKKFDGVILIASHKILSEVEKTLSSGLKQKITHKLAKDLVEYKKDELEKYLGEL